MASYRITYKIKRLVSTEKGEMEAWVDKSENVPDCYAVLGISQTASLEEIKKQYRILSRENHPDLNGTAEDKKAREQRQKEVNAAYDVLSNPEKKKAFDNVYFPSHSKSESSPPYRERPHEEHESNYSRQEKQSEYSKILQEIQNAHSIVQIPSTYILENNSSLSSPELIQLIQSAQKKRFDLFKLHIKDVTYEHDLPSMNLLKTHLESRELSPFDFSFLVSETQNKRAQLIFRNIESVKHSLDLPSIGSINRLLQREEIKNYHFTEITEKIRKRHEYFLFEEIEKAKTLYDLPFPSQIQNKLANNEITSWQSVEIFRKLHEKNFQIKSAEIQADSYFSYYETDVKNMLDQQRITPYHYSLLIGQINTKKREFEKRRW